ncbi:MAG: CCDC90 family protein [Magnetococcus sp. YQC-9]
MSYAAVTFDTLKFVETLKASGFDEPQAKGMAVAIQEVQKSNLADLATKGDIKELEARIEANRAELQRDIKELELRMVIKMGAMIIGGIGLLFGLMRVWPLPVQYVAPPAQEMRLPAPPPAR